MAVHEIRSSAYKKFETKILKADVYSYLQLTI